MANIGTSALFPGRDVYPQVGNSCHMHGYRGCFPGIRRSGREVDLSPATVVKVKNEWSYTFTHSQCV